MIHRRAFTLLGLLGLVGLATAPASAQTTSAIEVRVGETVSFTLPRLVQIIDTEDHAVATMVVTPDGHARITGVSEGRTRVIGRDLAQLPLIYPVTVVAARP
ncbi:MAG: hypothetical protein JWM10_2144 [Myxococcaceae bacterium]|nr:hypothetical protein [Myxococcaceae bacterium]